MYAETYGPRTALLYQVGGFFEIYDTENLTTGTTNANIRQIAELCQLSLTEHLVSDLSQGQKQTLFGGFPVDALPKFEKILVVAGWTVVVVVQKKGRTGLVEDRVVDHISSPGCFADQATRCLVGCVIESIGKKVYWAATAFDIATGSIWFTEGLNKDRLHQFLCMYPPSELVIWSDGLAAASTLVESVKNASKTVHIKCLGPASAAVDEAMLGRFWTLKLLTWMHKEPQSRRCLAALMEFASDHMPSALKSLGEPERWVPDGEVRLGNAALEQLGLLSLRDSSNEGLLGLMDKCRSVAGRRLLRARLLRPISDVAELERRLDRIEAVSLLEAPVIEKGLRSLYDMSRLWRKLELGSASLGDMSCLLRSYEAAASLGCPHKAFFEWIFARWNTAATVELGRAGRSVPIDALPFVEGVYPELDALFGEGLAIKKEALDLCASWKEALYLDDAEGGGFRATGTKRRVSAAWTALRDDGDLSAVVTAYKTSATLETATLSAISARHRAWMQRWAISWSTAWSGALAELVSRGLTEAFAVEDWCADLDLSWTAKGWAWVRPVFLDGVDGSSIDVIGLRHPILERLIKVPYVSHSLSLESLPPSPSSPSPSLSYASSPSPPPSSSPPSPKTGVLLYGMNASGKSSLMKALGLCVLLAQAGFPVPATAMRLAPFTAIFTRILGNDNLWAGLSSFAVEMTEFREILQFADERSLVLGDELCSGTESLSATALVAAGIEVLASRGSKFVFATHLHELASLVPATTVSCMHLKVHYDPVTDRLIYDRELAPGSGSALYGLEVCRSLDLPAGYLDRATAIRKQLAGWTAPHRSTYSADTVIDRCEVCEGLIGLETHHIIHQEHGGSDHASNLVCLCSVCHDDHHGGRLMIEGWIETGPGTGRSLKWSRPTTAGSLDDEIVAWIKEQRQRKIRVATIQRMAKQIFGIALTSGQVKM